jgi:excisionase family DNA binding protein
MPTVTAMFNDPMREMEAFLTTEEVLAYLKITPRTIYRLIRSGELPAVRIGRQWRFRRADLDRWLERQRAFSTSSV